MVAAYGELSANATTIPHWLPRMLGREADINIETAAVAHLGFDVYLTRRKLLTQLGYPNREPN